MDLLDDEEDDSLDYGFDQEEECFQAFGSADHVLAADQARADPTAAQAAAASAPGSSKQWQNYETVFTNAKAGMAGVNKELVKQVVYEMSKDSPHFKNEQRKQQQTDQRTQKMLARSKQLSAHELEGHTRQMDKKLAALKATQDLTRTWIHCDMDAFYAAVEELHDPSLKSKPMAVGGIGMICTANYEARKYGVRAAMPGFIGRRLCPQLLFAKPDFSKYTKAAEGVRAVLRLYDPEFECASLDEAYLDVTDYCQAHNMTGAEVAQALRSQVHAATQLTCSCGVAANRLLAKICSDINKPNGQAVLPSEPGAIRKFMEELPVRKVPMIGRVTEGMLRQLGVTKCADLLASRGLLGALYSDIATDHFMAVALGIGRTTHGEPAREGEAGRKGKSVERTFAAISSPAEQDAKCAELAEKLAADLQSEGLKGKTLTLKLKAISFEVRTRAATLPQHVDSLEAILAAALRLLRPEQPIDAARPAETSTVPSSLSPDSDRAAQTGEAGMGQEPARASGSMPADMSGPSQQGAGPASQPFELSLRDWADPATSSQVPGTQQTAPSESRQERVQS
ncbi:hypothetical protein WJX73_010443 [Symbiochloris irregularis]|uniref:DNA polymerase kappa n=1 Tax=Symbiochloris irregularis TaxID=706552 RepID=A0AAW1NWP6_9CHLO